MEFHEVLEHTLRELFRVDRVELETTTTGRVGGVVVSPDFQDKSQSDRQDQLWSALESRLSKAELARIVSLLTLTPAELVEVD